ncbi:uncharacterized protein B0I36DRAFT_368450 [Microdochium trichocladiopsis]|uniref:Protein kinase domain-containing protein n=1 Tax=Microdochium trichocladiopsis TaxID=1682393 RepID=A0A9P8XV26_9PEZI|nr:uncharacterized protein B0I36DRAFT_368450 [Microdochium trichocladiopsis]KAH7018431.1 hypothetical protein B0I36DRAFT_368450 [Microdochium trichocladiopsis]
MTRGVFLDPLRRDARPRPLLQSDYIQQEDGGETRPSVFLLDFHDVMLEEDSPGSGRLVMYSVEWDETHEDWAEDPDPAWRYDANTLRCWKTTDVYEQLLPSPKGSGTAAQTVVGAPALPHPRILNYLGSDPWTRFPLLEMPSGTIPLTEFLTRHLAALYPPSRDGQPSPQPRIDAAYLPLVYQWTLHMVSALSFLHTNEIVLGDLSADSCWLSSPEHVPPLQLSIAGFPDAHYRSYSHSGVQINGFSTSSAYFHPLREVSSPSRATDISLVGCMIYKFMTGEWPARPAASQDREEINALFRSRTLPVSRWVREGRGPALERAYLGDIARKCWRGDYGEDVQALREDLTQFIAAEGWVIEDGDDMLKDFSLEGLSLDKTV